ncbi:hypothetical protein PBC5_083 [Bacillus phage PBC5]|nr:hypothetical protein PBC5_083 [Bacillus phage PBC5]
MDEQKRKELIAFCVGAVEAIEGVKVSDEEFSKLEDDELQKEADWFDYLLDK